MIQNDKVYTCNTSKRLPILFCLDVSPSMSWPDQNGECSIDLLNIAVKNFVKELQADPMARTCAEIAFVTFSSQIEMDTKFQSVGKMKAPVFCTVEEGGTQMASAVLKSIDKIEERRKQLENSMISYYAPFLVLVTDGNPDQNDNGALYEKALRAVRSHCDSHVGAREIIVPFIIGVGEHVDKATLSQFSAGFTDGFIHIGNSSSYTSNQFNQVFQMISNSTKVSVHLNMTGAGLINVIKSDMEDLQEELNAM